MMLSASVLLHVYIVYGIVLFIIAIKMVLSASDVLHAYIVYGIVLFHVIYMFIPKGYYMYSIEIYRSLHRTMLKASHLE